LLLQGRTEGQAPDIDGHVLINDSNDVETRVGDFYSVEITGSMEYDMIGRII
jgi:ribosomal protein S12 methylthiotransferase